jgi:hypothetical protein
MHSGTSGLESSTRRIHCVGRGRVRHGCTPVSEAGSPIPPEICSGHAWPVVPPTSPQALWAWPRRPPHTLERRHRMTQRSSALAAVLSVLLAGLLGGCAEPAVNANPRSTRGTVAAKGVELDGSSLPPWPAPNDVAARVASAGWILALWGRPTITTRTCGL